MLDESSGISFYLLYNEGKKGAVGMPSYAVPISSALIVFAIIAFLGTVPWTIYQYRKHGYFSFWRNVVIFSFIYYCLTAFFLVSLPLPKDRDNTLMFKDHVFTQLKPLNMLTNFKAVPGFDPSSVSTYPTLFKSFTFLEVFFNVLLLFPLGIYLRYFLKSAKKLYIALGLIFLTTLFFEVSQLTALFGYYAHPYRLFDVDDLLANTLGGMIGFFVAPVFLHFIPSRDALKEKDASYGPEMMPSYGAQLVEVFVSIAIARFIGSVFSMIAFKGDELFWWNLVFIFFFLVIFPIMTKGKTLGGMVVKIKFHWGEKNQFLPLCYRFLIVSLPSIVSKIGSSMNQVVSDNMYLISFQLLILLTVFFVWLFFWFVILRDWAKKKREPFFNAWVPVEMIRYKK